MSDLDQQIAAAERRLESLKAAQPFYHELTCYAMEMEPSWPAGAGVTADLAFRYVGMVQNYNQCMEQERQLLAGLRMEQKAEEQ